MIDTPRRRGMRRRAASAPLLPPQEVQTPTPMSTARRRGIRRRPIPLPPPPTRLGTLPVQVERAAAPPPPVPVQFTSQINPAYPVHGNPTTQSVRDNFSFAKAEIEALQAQSLPDAPEDGQTYGRDSATWNPVLPTGGGQMTGAITLAAAPAHPMEPVNLGYLQTYTPPGQIADAPPDGRAYGRQSATWAHVIAATGDVVDGGNF